MAQTLQLYSPSSGSPTQTRNLKKELLPNNSLKLFKASKVFVPNIQGISINRSRTASSSPIVCSVGGDASNPSGISTEINKSLIASAPIAFPLDQHEPDPKRSDFPPDFIFGAASAAYQTEGAWNEDGRTPSIWDWYSQTYPNRIDDGSNGNVATDGYHKYKEDIRLLKEMNADIYRFSISWSRILPDGENVNHLGVAYYNNVINECKNQGIIPFVTIFHWDVPLVLQDKFGGFLSKDIIPCFEKYAKVCFDNFGDRVKHWITLNEPWTFAVSGYCLGWHAPGRGSPKVGGLAGDSATEPYIVTHNLILSHAAAATLYRTQYQPSQKGEIGITVNSLWLKPYTNTFHDIQATDRAMDFMLGWYMEPLVYGDYPFVMRSIVGNRLPTFTDDEKKLIRKSFDFIGLNYYSTKNVMNLPIISLDDKPGYYTYFDDYCAQLRENRPDGGLVGPLDGSWIYVYPMGLKDLLKYVNTRYESPAIYITENGTCEDDPGLPMEAVTNDEYRINYLRKHINELKDAVSENCNVKGYITWSITDNYEWQKGYAERFGLVYIDYNNNRNRVPKKSYGWYQNVLKRPEPIEPIEPIAPIALPTPPTKPIERFVF